MNRRNLVLHIAVPIASLALAIAIWQVAAGTTETFILPSPGQVYDALIDDWDIIGPALWVTLKLTVLALLLAVIGGVGLALLMIQSRWIEIALYPYAVILQVTPIIAIAPLLLIWVPETDTALLILAFIVAFFPILTNTAQGLKSVDHNLHNLFDLYGAGPWQILTLLRAPSALPYFLTGLRIAGGLALIAAVVAEFAAGTGGAESGLAYRILEAQFWLDTPRAFAALFVLAATGVAIFAATSVASYFAMRRWHESASEREN
jgi:NitT/TauT family transport system permease protein